MRSRLLLGLLVICAGALGTALVAQTPAQPAAPAPLPPGFVAAKSPAGDFVPDYLFTGSALTGWQTLGAVDWRAENGVITGTARTGGSGGWLVYSKSYEDVGFFSRFRCADACDAGLLLRAEKTPTGMKGVLVAMNGTEVAPFRVTMDADGKILTRETARGGGRGGAPAAGAAGAAPAAGGRGAGAAGADPAAAGGRGGAGGGRGGGGAAGGAAGAAPAAGGRGGGGGAATSPIIAAVAAAQSAPVTIVPGQWNSVEVLLSAGTIANHVNDIRNAVQGGNTGETDVYAYGPVALYVGSGSVQFSGVAIKDLNLHTEPVEQSSNRFRVQRLTDFTYSWGADAADINQDGVMDIVAGPFYYLGPDYTKRREIYRTHTYSPGQTYVDDMTTFAVDFTGDNYPDVLATERRPIVMYVNPKGENRHWQKFAVLPEVCSEVSIRADVDGDGKQEVVYVGGDGRVAYGEPDPANPTAPWLIRKISEPVVAGCNTHGLGVGDVNGDGRADILQARGWWEQPATGQATSPWRYHEAAFGKITRVPQHPGGGEISVYDFNGDKLNDVVASHSAHGWGLSWYEQKKDASGTITFVEHPIMGDFSMPSAGGVVFSEVHSGATLIDVDRDGIMDFVAGKRHWSHLDSQFTDPDPQGAGVVYWYRTVRNPRSPGGVQFVPELIHNRSGVGSEIKAIDVNKDGLMDLITSGTRGAFVFWGR